MSYKEAVLILAVLVTACGKKHPVPGNKSDSSTLEHITADGRDIKMVDGLAVSSKGGKSAPFTGTVIYKYENGEKREELNCVNGNWQGEIKWWYEDGTKAGEGKLLSLGKWDGEYKEWYENGQQKIQVNFRDGKEQGKEIWWYESNQTKKVTQYKNGKKEGRAIGFYETGSKKWDATWAQGKPDGEYKEYYSNGDLKSIVRYQEGERHGMVEVWYEDDGRRNLPHRHAKKIEFKGGEIDGLYQEWWLNGEKKKEATYKSGKKDGELVLWGEDGKVTTRTIYKDGKVVKANSGSKE